MRCVPLTATSYDMIQTGVARLKRLNSLLLYTLSCRIYGSQR
jgi:hypothetical protein